MLAANAELSQFTQEEWESLMHGEKFECQVSFLFIIILRRFELLIMEN